MSLTKVTLESHPVPASPRTHPPECTMLVLCSLASSTAHKLLAFRVMGFQVLRSYLPWNKDCVGNNRVISTLLSQPKLQEKGQETRPYTLPSHSSWNTVNAYEGRPNNRTNHKTVTNINSVSLVCGVTHRFLMLDCA